MSVNNANQNPISVGQFKGLNERGRFNNIDVTEFDKLLGYSQQFSGIIERPNGTLLLQQIPGHRILGIHQTFDDRQNVIIQTDQGVRVISEDALFNRASGANLTPVVIPEEDTMAEAILAHTVASGITGGAYAVASVWQDAPLTDIIHQRNADGTAAAFVTALAANVFTLAAGVYRIEFESTFNDNAGNSLCQARLFNTTTGLPAWDGLNNKQATSQRVIAPGTVLLKGRGWLDLSGGPASFKLQHWCSTVTDANGFGQPSTTGDREVYRWIKVLKTA